MNPGAPPLNVWLVDDDASIRWVMERALCGSTRPDGARKIFKILDFQLKFCSADDFTHANFQNKRFTVASR